MRGPRGLRALLARPGIIVAPGAYDAVSARLIERAGFPAVYIGSYATAAARLGVPDAGLVGLREMVDHAAAVAGAVDGVPVIADAENGFGTAATVWRTVREFERAGVAGIHLEDHEFGKHLDVAGRVLDRDAMAEKIRAAVEAREDRDFVVIARTDAYGAVGGSLEEAIWRGRAYADAGVDLVWCELSTAGREPAIAFARAMRETHPRLPLAFNYSSSFKWSADPNPLLFRELGELGYKFIFITLFAAHAGMYAVWNAMEDLVKNQEQAQWALEQVKAGHPTESHHVMARVDRFKELEQRYVPGAEDRYRASDGFGQERRPS